ncbi:Cell division protein FtsN [Microcystis aeruginosa NIES-98]|nr:Cell division protein FtsN [Microcystis aeruginosa NIES-98]
MAEISLIFNEKNTSAAVRSQYSGVRSQETPRQETPRQETPRQETPRLFLFILPTPHTPHPN